MPVDNNFVRATIIYDPLDLANFQSVELEYQPGKSLSHYIEGLPEEVNWDVVLDNSFVPKGGHALTFPKKQSSIIVAPVPHGGDDGGKSILALVASIALTFAAPWAGGWLATSMNFAVDGLAATLFTAGVSIAGGMLINSFLPRPDQAEGSAQTYGLDGPKNTSEEGIPVPVLYGKFGFGGNIVDLYTENATDSDGTAIQFLYGRTIVSEGPIKSVGDFRFNDQPESSFEDVEVDFRLGGGDQAPSPWFDGTVSLYNQSRDFTETFQTYETIGEVDKIRMDVTFPAGLIFRDDKGREVEQSVTLVMEYRSLGSADPWLPLATRHIWVDSTATPTDPGDKFRVQVNYTPAVKTRTVFTRDDRSATVVASSNPDYALEYRVNGGAWTEYKRYQNAEGGPMNGADFVAGTTQHTETLEGFDNDTVEFRIVNNATVNGTFPAADITVNRIERKTDVGSAEITITEASPTPLRKTFTTDVLPEDRYEIRYRRTTPELTEDTTKQDKVTLTDVGEIVIDPVNMNYSAWAGFKIRLSGQLNGVPKFTGEAEGIVMPIFDHEGNVTQVAYSNNPADVVLDAYMNARYGGRIEFARIDFAAFAEWRDYCTANGLTFNGLYSELGNIDDQIKHAYIAGRAQRLTQGAKVSVVIDGLAEPVMMFNSTLIKKGSLDISYLSYAERVNDISVSYFDEDDLYQNRTVRAVNDTALARGEELKSSSIVLKGVTNAARAQKEANFRMNYNRYVTRTASWVSPLQSISCTVGDVVILQSEMVDWKVGGLLKSGSTSTVVNLDRPVEFETGVNYALLVHRDTRKIADVSITSQASNLVTVNAVLADDGSARRLKVGATDYAVLRVLPGATTTDLLLKDAPALSGAAEVWSTDVIDEVAVTHPGAGEYSTLTLSEALTDGAPPEFSTFIFGPSVTQEREFRITDMKRENEAEATLTAVEYAPEVYDDSNVHTGTLFGTRPVGAHVTDLEISESTKIAEGGARFIEITAVWKPGDNNYIGALVQYRVDDRPWLDFAYTSDTSVRIPVVRGDAVRVRIIAKTETGFLATAAAPSAFKTIVGFEGTPDAPEGWAAVSTQNTITFKEPEGVDRGVAPYDTQLMSEDTTFRSFQLWSGAVGSLFSNASKIADFSASRVVVDLPLNASDKDYWLTVTDTSGNVSAASTVITAGPQVPRTVTLTAADQVFEYDSAGENPTPGNSTFTATAGYTPAGTLYYDFLVDGVSQANSVTNTYSYTPQLLQANMPERVTVRIREDATDGEVLAEDSITVLGLKEGSNGISMLLTNESHDIPADVNGNSPDFTGAVTDAKIYEGATDVTGQWTFAKVDSTGVTSTITGGQVTVTGITVDSGYIDITASRAGFSDITKRMSLARVKQGATGLQGADAVTGTIVWVDSDTITKEQGGSYSPSSTAVLFDAIFYEGGVRVAQERFQFTRSGDTWSTTVSDPADAGDLNTSRISDSNANVNGRLANTTITYSYGGKTAKIDANVRIVFDGVDGGTGPEGTSVAQLSIFRRSATNLTSAPTGGSFDFTANTITPPTNWDDEVPAGTDDLYQSIGSASVSGGATVDSSITWSVPKKVASLGTQGDPGKSTFQGVIFKRSNGVPAAPSGGSFHFGTNTFTPPTGWDTSPPSGTDPVYATRWLFQIIGDDTSDTAGTWPTPELFVADGTDGVSTYLAQVFQRSVTDLTVAPTGGSYDFGANSLTVPTGGGTWSGEIPTGSAPTWVSTALASASGPAGVDSSLTWTTPRLLAKNGVNGKLLPVGASTITKDAQGNYSASTLDFDVEFYQDGTVIAADRFRVTRSGGGWASNPTNPTGGSNIDTTSMTDTLSIDGVNAVLRVVHDSGASVSVAVSIISDGVNGVEALVKPVSGTVITRNSDGATYSASTLDFDVEVKRDNVTIAGDRFRLTRSGDTWNGSASNPTGGPSVDTTSLSDSVVVSGTDATLTVVHADTGVSTSVTATIMFDGTNGNDAITIVFSNDSHTIPTDYFGNNADYSGSGTDITLFEGDTKLDWNGVGTTPGTWKVDESGSGITPDATPTDFNNAARYGDHSNMTGDTAEITYTINGERLDGTPFTFTRKQTFSKVKGGERPPGRWEIGLSTAEFDALSTTTADNEWNDTGNPGTRPARPAVGDQAWFYEGSQTSPTRQEVYVCTAVTSDVSHTWAKMARVIDGNLLVTDSVYAGAIVIDGITLDRDGDNLIIKQGGVATAQLGANSASAPLIDDTGTLTGPQTKGEMCTLQFDVTDVKEVALYWQFDQSYASGEAPDWGWSIERGTTEIGGRHTTLMEFGNDQPTGVVIDKTPGTGTVTYYLYWWSNDANLDADGYFAITGARKK